MKLSGTQLLNNDDRLTYLRHQGQVVFRRGFRMSLVNFLSQKFLRKGHQLQPNDQRPGQARNM